MNHEPLGTDTPREDKSAPRNQSFEGQLTNGCLIIVVGSLVTFALGFWPFLVFEQLSQPGLQQTLLIGAAGTLPLAFILPRIGKGAGLAGFIGGIACCALAMFLRLQMIAIGRGDPLIPQPDYPAGSEWMVPLIWSLTLIAIAVIFQPKSAFEDE